MKAGKELENYVQFVYQKLFDFMDEGAMVSSNVSVCKLYTKCIGNK